MKKIRGVTVHYREQVDALNRFKHKNKRLPKRNEELGSWCANQKYYYRQGKLSKEQIRLLKSSGLLLTGEYNFCTRMDLVGDFYESYGRVPFRDEQFHGHHVGQWWYRIQAQLIEYSMSEDCLQYVRDHYPELYSIAMEQDLKTFLSWAQLLEMYQKETGKTEPKNREKYMGHWLGSWCCKQRRLFKAGELSEKQILILKNLGVLTDSEEAAQ